MNDWVHVFVGRFESPDDARTYTEAKWKPKPGESASDEEWEAWEERNPQWPLRSDLDVYLDSDFIEVILAPGQYSYLQSLLLDRQDADRITQIDPDANTLVLVFREALGGFDAAMKSTPSLTYCGEFACDLTPQGSSEADALIPSRRGRRSRRRLRGGG
jgi:hypothetical protein